MCSDSPHFTMSQNAIIHKSLVNTYLSLKHLHVLFTMFLQNCKFLLVTGILMFLQLRYLLMCLRKKYAQGKIFTLLLSVIGRYFSCKGFPAINTIVILTTEVVALKHLVLKYCLSKPLFYNYCSFWPSYIQHTECYYFLSTISRERTKQKYLLFRWKLLI